MWCSGAKRVSWRLHSYCNGFFMNSLWTCDVFNHLQLWAIMSYQDRYCGMYIRDIAVFDLWNVDYCGAEWIWWYSYTVIPLKLCELNMSSSFLSESIHHVENCWDNFRFMVHLFHSAVFCCSVLLCSGYKREMNCWYDHLSKCIVSLYQNV